MCGVRPGGGERAVACCTPVARRKEAEAHRRRLGNYGIHLSKEGGAGGPVVLSRDAGVGGDLRSPRKRRVVPGSGEGLKFFGCITFHVGGRWVWPIRSNEGRSEGCVWIRRLGPPANPLRSASLADCTLYTGLDEVAEEQTQLFRCPEQDVPVLLPRQPCFLPLVGGSGPRTRTHPQARGRLEPPHLSHTPAI